MGRSVLMRYVLRLRYAPDPLGRRWADSPGEWRVKEAGKPTPENIHRYVEVFVQSQYPGGVNEHLAKDAGYLLVPVSATITKQPEQRVVAEWTAPKFMALPSGKAPARRGGTPGRSRARRSRRSNPRLTR